MGSHAAPACEHLKQGLAHTASQLHSPEGFPAAQLDGLALAVSCVASADACTPKLNTFQAASAHALGLLGGVMTMVGLGLTDTVATVRLLATQPSADVAFASSSTVKDPSGQAPLLVHVTLTGALLMAVVRAAGSMRVQMGTEERRASEQQARRCQDGVQGRSTAGGHNARAARSWPTQTCVHHRACRQQAQHWGTHPNCRQLAGCSPHS